MFYISHALHGVKERYIKLEKFTLVVILIIQKLGLYFQAHPMAILIDMPFRLVFSKIDLSGRMMKYTIELNTYRVQFQPREVKEG